MKDHTQENSWFTDFKEFQESVDKPAKDKANSHFRNKYASFEACLEAIMDGQRRASPQRQPPATGLYVGQVSAEGQVCCRIVNVRP